jgi:hypothetical protein
MSSVSGSSPQVAYTRFSVTSGDTAAVEDAGAAVVVVDAGAGVVVVGSADDPQADNSANTRIRADRRWDCMAGFLSSAPPTGALPSSTPIIRSAAPPGSGGGYLRACMAVSPS